MTAAITNEMTPELQAKKDIAKEEYNRITTTNGASIVLYTTDDGNTQLEVKLENETVWLTQNQMAELFGRDRTVHAI